MTTNPKDPRQIEAEIRKAEADALKAHADARKAAADAAAAERITLPQEVPDGGLDVPDQPAPIASVAIYRALGQIATTIAAKLDRAMSEAASTEALWVVPDGEYGVDIATYQAVSTELTRLVGLVEESVDGNTDDSQSNAGLRGFVDPATIIGLAASAAPLVLSLMSTSRTIRSATTDVDFLAVAAHVNEKVSDREVFVRGVTQPVLPEAFTQQVARLWAARETLATEVAADSADSTPSRVEAEQAATAEAWRTVLSEAVKGKDATQLGELQLDNIVTKIATATGASKKAAADSAASRREVVRQQEILSRVDDLLTKLTDSESSLAARCALGAAMKDAQILLLKPVYAGAETTYEDVKLKRDRGLHVGSCVVSWFLVDSGELIASGVEHGVDSATTTVGLPAVNWAPEGS